MVTAASGYDMEYPLKGASAAGERTAGGYYTSAAQQGEAAGRWFGPGAAQLGLAGEVDHDHYRVVYGDRPADPFTGEALGAPKRDFTRSYQAKLARLMAEHPEATAEQVRDLERQARRETRQSPAYTDVTVEFSKSVSILHGSIRENARRAREAGDEAAAAWWDARELRFSEILQTANARALDHLQEWAGVTRTGYHGRMVDGRELGKWEPAEMMATSWLQGTSRAGEMHDHIHNAVHPKVRTRSDGKWRATDTMAIRNQLPAMAAIEAAYAEAALSREFGVEWIPRPDGMGNEVRGITQAEIDAYSSRREAVDAKMADLARDFLREYSREPNQRELTQLHREAWAITRPAKDDRELIDWDKTAATWDDALGGKLGGIAARVSWLAGPGSREPGPVRLPAVPDADALARATRQALAAVQGRLATWTRADLMKQVGVAVPAELKGTDPAAAVELISALTDRALAGEFEQVQAAEAAEPVALPSHLRHEVNGRSVYTRPGAERYFTQVQLSLEERLIAQAEAQSAPCLPRGRVAELLGADAGVLEAAMRERAGRGSTLTGSGLRLDQAAALHHVLTSPRTGDVLVGPAGSGKTRTLAEAARAWIDGTGGTVIGLATAQAARNVLAAAGVELAENTSQFLGHSPGQRGARGVRDLPAGSLILIDEASMMSTADLADIMAFARSRGCKVVVAGDNQQLAAVEGGGGMMLLARRLGYVQLAEAVRFDQQWERDASLGLRRGELAALDEYDDHGRLTGDEPERAIDMARAAYVGHYLAGTDVLMIARSRELCAELSRRVRDDLVHLGKVDDSRTVTLGNRATAGAGDVIVARKNDHRLAAGQAGRHLANGDVLRVQAVNDDGSLSVVRRTGKDEHGRQTWTDEAFRFDDLRNAELGYAVTGHSAQGLTVTAGLAVVTGSEGRQWFYTAMTRGAETNQAFVFTQPRNVSQPQQGTAPAPELARARRIERERAGLPEQYRAPLSNPEARDPRSVAADVLERDDSQDSALETRDREAANADHLARLDVMWEGEARAARADRYRAAVRAALPAGFETADLDGGHATWLYRSLRHAEAGGLDARDVIRRAVADRDLTGARDVAAVLDARVRAQTGNIAPAPWRPWSERVPETGDRIRDAFLRELAAAMDDRKARLGEYTAETAPAWAVSRLGPVPEDEAERAGWTERAAHVAAYRELYGWEDEREAIGPEPVNSPEARAAWFAAFGAMNRTDEAGLDRLSEGSLWLMRATYERETAWAPPHAGGELKLAYSAALNSRAQAALAEAEADAARRLGDDAAARRHDTIAASAKSAGGLLQSVIAADEALMADRREWSERTAGPRMLAVQADAELRRRDPGARIEPLKSAEPDPAPEALPALTDEAVQARIEQIAATRAAYAAALAERAGMQVPAEDPDMEPEGEAWPRWLPAEREAVLQPPKPLMPARQPQAEAERDAEAV